MAKGKVAYVCNACGHDEPKWLGHCPSCGEWSSFKEVRLNPSSGRSVTSLHSARINHTGTPTILADVDPTPPQKYPTGNEELNRVLGGGLTPGVAVLLGGEPGIGKSTLMLQVATNLPGLGLYISGEESPGQIKTRADRLELPQNGLEILCETCLENLMELLRERKPDYLVVDSIQTLVSEEAGIMPGTPSQLKIAGYRLTTWAKATGTPLFLIAHVTREGTIAGPKVIEHLVDTVLYFDHSSSDLRILRSSKNRMGSVDEVGLFRMSASGLTPIADPAGLFLEHRNNKDGPPQGSAVAAVYEGSRVLLVEIQALTIPAKGGMGRIYSDRIDNARVSRIAAVLERHAGLKLSDHDIYVNVAGGLRINDTGVELALALSLFSAQSGKALPGDMVAVGEISLAGEVRPVPHLRRRIKTAANTGLNRFCAATDSDAGGDFPGKGHVVLDIRDALATAILQGS